MGVGEARMEHQTSYHFGSFRLENSNRLLFNQIGSEQLPVKEFLLLLYFLQNQGRLITRQEIFNELWYGRVVEDVTLRFAINYLRKVLQDDPKSPRYISTVCKSGYRFLPEVKVETSTFGLKPVADVNNGAYLPKPTAPKPLFPPVSAMPVLMAEFKKAAEGNRRLVLLKGVHGTGKSESIALFLNELNASSAYCLRACCIPLDFVTEPFLPLIEALEKNANTLLELPVFSDFAQFAPHWHSQLRCKLKLGSIEPQASGILHFNPARMLREGVDIFEALSNDKVFVLVIDNVQWCDGFTLDLMSFLMFRSSPAKLLILLGFRPDSVEGAAILKLRKMEEELTYQDKCLSIQFGRQVDYLES